MIVPGDGYAAARGGAAFTDRSDRLRLQFTGAQAAATLNGLLTNDIAALGATAGCYAAALTVKGKVIADVRVFARDGGFLVDCAPSAGDGLLAMFRKFVNPRLATYRDVSSETCTIGVFGPSADRVVAAACGCEPGELAALSLYSHLPTGGAPPGIVARIPDLGVTGFDVIAARSDADLIMAALVSAGAGVLDSASAEVLRVEAGRPLYGADMDENVLAQEAALDTLGAISFDKGCYTGQETVARVHFRGHVNRMLRGITCPQPIEPGSELMGSDGTVVGHLRSAVQSPSLGPIALAYVRREIADGSTVSVKRSDGDATARVVPLPFL